MTRDFNTWLSHFKTSIATYDYYVDFPKVYQNIDSIKVELNILNALIGHPDIENEFIRLVEKYPEVLKCVPLLLAVRGKEVEITDEKGSRIYRFDKIASTPQEYAEFMRKSGLFGLLQQHLVSNLVDYATGVETVSFCQFKFSKLAAYGIDLRSSLSLFDGSDFQTILPVCINPSYNCRRRSVIESPAVYRQRV